MSVFTQIAVAMLTIGCPWRDMHERYGKWNSVYVRFRRWAEQGVWDAHRYDKTKTSFAAFLAIATAKIWLPHFVNMTQIGVDRCGAKTVILKLTAKRRHRN